MSYILDALRKAENEERKKVAPVPLEIFDRPKQKKISAFHGIGLIVIIITLNIIITGSFIYFKSPLFNDRAIDVSQISPESVLTGTALTETPLKINQNNITVNNKDDVLHPVQHGENTHTSKIRYIYSYKSEVIGVTDGCQIDIKHEDRIIKTVFADILCSEKRSIFGRVAKRFTTDRIFPKTVWIRVVEQRSSNSIVADVFTEDKQIFLNSSLVSEGLAGSVGKRFASEQLEAIKKHRGMWSAKIIN